VKKITLITPPDFYENGNYSILLIGITEEEQDQISHQLGQLDSDTPLNIYYFQGENNMEWLLFALNRCDAVYINADSGTDLIKWLASYMLGKSNVWYTTSDDDLKSLFSYINQKYVPNISKFIEAHFDDKK
jgi:hypothetical protein